MFEKNNYNSDKLTIAIILSALAAVFSILGFFFNAGNQNIEQSVLKALNNMEAFKVGGQDNWNKVQQLYSNPQFISSQSSQIDAALQSLWTTPDAPSAQQPSQDAAPTNNTLTDDQLSSILDNQPFSGNEDSDIVLVEYSDFECPFCQKHFDSGVVGTLIAWSDISYTFKHFPLSSIHPKAEKAAEGALCVLNLSGKDAYFAYINQVFASKDPSLENITRIAKDIGAKEANFTNCLDSAKEEATVASHMQEAQSLFNINGTPGNVLINKKTGKYIVVSGAQPLSAFTAAIAQIK